MQTFYKIIFAITMAIISNFSYAENLPKAQQYLTHCKFNKMPVIFSSVDGAIKGKEKKLEKKIMMESISMLSEDSWDQSFMKEILDEVYDYPTLDDGIHQVYRAELCYWQSHKPNQGIASDFKRAYPLLKKCSHRDSKCAMKVVHQLFNIKAQ